MPSQRVADAANIAPYLTHAVSHHGQVTLVPPDNAGRVRQAKPKKSRARGPVPERNVRPEEEIRFNTGPRPFRALIARGGGRRPPRPEPSRPGRREETNNDGNNEAYPDYPPPSFLEAISTPPLSVSSSTTTLVHAPQPILPPSLAVPPDSPPPSLPSASQQFPRHPLSRQNSEDSEDSLEIIEMDSVPDDGLPSGSRLEEGVRKDWVNRRGVEFPAPPRGRTKSRAVVDSDSGGDQTPPVTPKRRHMSLSPLRTLFPYQPMTVQDRAMSAHPSPNSSPYSCSRSAFPFLSTTSLKMSMSTTSFLRLPLTSTSSSASERRESFVARTLSSFKGKERERRESLDTWEVVESEPSPTITPSNEPSTPRLKGSPTRSQSFTYGTPVDSTRSVEAEPVVSPTSATSPHPLSLRDRKAPPIPFVKRPKQRRAPPPPPASTEPAPAGPILTSVRTRKTPPPPPPKKKPQIIASSPLGADSWRPDDDMESATSILQRALTIPLPLTPVDAPRLEYETTPVAPVVSDHGRSPPTPMVPPVFPHLSTDLNRSNETPYKIPFDELPELIDKPNSLHAISIPLPRPSVPMSPLVYSQKPEPGPSTPRHHYPGRPLPRPPGTTRALVDSTYGGNDALPDEVRFDVHCPEGLLIDLDDMSLTGHSGTSTPRTDRSHVQASGTPSSTSSTEFLGLATDSTIASNCGSSTVSTALATLASATPSNVSPSEFLGAGVVSSNNGGSALSTPTATIAPATPSSASSTEFSGSTTDSNLSSTFGILTVPTPIAALPPASHFSEFTDLDVLVSRLNEEHRNGTDYETLLRLSEFIGPASPIHGSAGTLPAPLPPGSTVAHGPTDNVPLLGSVEVERRRVTKDGRIKLKLMLIDASVDKCGICLNQFKNDEIGRLGSACRHAFHNKCLGRWLVRSKTCPMCRVPFVDQS